MNLNEKCLLNFLVNPDEIKEITDLFTENVPRSDVIKDKNHIESLIKVLNCSIAR